MHEIWAPPVTTNKTTTHTVARADGRRPARDSQKGTHARAHRAAALPPPPRGAGRGADQPARVRDDRDEPLRRRPLSLRPELQGVQVYRPSVRRPPKAPSCTPRRGDASSVLLVCTATRRGVASDLSAFGGVAVALQTRRRRHSSPRRRVAGWRPLTSSSGPEPRGPRAMGGEVAHRSHLSRRGYDARAAWHAPSR